MLDVAVFFIFAISFRSDLSCLHHSHSTGSSLRKVTSAGRLPGRQELLRQRVRGYSGSDAQHRCTDTSAKPSTGNSFVERPTLLTMTTKKRFSATETKFTISWLPILFVLQITRTHEMGICYEDLALIRLKYFVLFRINGTSGFVSYQSCLERKKPFRLFNQSDLWHIVK